MISIRKAQAQDARRISDLIRNNLEQLNLNNYSEAQVNTWTAANSPAKILNQLKRRSLFCAFEHNKMVGTIGLDAEMVVGLYVAYTHTGKGVGAKLLRYLEDYAREQGILKLELLSTPSGKGFYQKHGFKSIRKEITLVGDIEYLETFMEKYL